MRGRGFNSNEIIASVQGCGTSSSLGGPCYQGCVRDKESMTWWTSKIVQEPLELMPFGAPYSIWDTAQHSWLRGSLRHFPDQCCAQNRPPSKQRGTIQVQKGNIHVLFKLRWEKKSGNLNEVRVEFYFLNPNRPHLVPRGRCATKQALDRNHSFGTKRRRIGSGKISWAHAKQEVSGRFRQKLYLRGLEPSTSDWNYATLCSAAEPIHNI